MGRRYGEDDHYDDNTMPTGGLDPTEAARRAFRAWRRWRRYEWMRGNSQWYTGRYDPPRA